MIRLLMVDDHPIVRSGLAQMLSLAPDVHLAGQASQGLEAMALLRQHAFDVLLLDLTMPGISGTDLITRIKSQQPELPILVLSVHNSTQVAAQALQAGAAGFISKDCEPTVLLDAIRKVATHGHYITPEIAAQLAFAASTPNPHAPYQCLTERERSVLRLLVKGLAVKEIGAQLAISSKTVSTHKARLMEKLDTPSMADLMRYAIAYPLPD